MIKQNLRSISSNARAYQPAPGAARWNSTGGRSNIKVKGQVAPLADN